MSAVSEAFLNRLGPARANVPVGFDFKRRRDRFSLEDLIAEIGAGYFMDGFTYLFGEGISDYDPLLKEWPFLFREEKQRIVIGKNAYGALLVLEDPDEWGTAAPGGLVDPLRVSYYTDPNLTFMGMVGNWLPQEKLPSFLEDRIYREWRARSGRDLEKEEILAIKAPLSLGGSFELPNFQVENIFEYYQSTGSIYRKHFS